MVKRYYKKRKNAAAKKTKRTRKSRKMTTNVIGFPTTYFMKQRYEQTYYASLAASASVSYILRNSLFDPDQAGTGHQTLYFDQMSTLYNKYVITGYWYKITVLGTSNGNSTLPLQMNIQPRTTFNTDTNTDTASERAYDRKYTIVGGQSPKIIKGYISVAKLWSTTISAVYTNPEFHGNTGSTLGTNPAKAAALTILFQNPWALAAEYMLTVELTFKCKFFDLIHIAGS